MAAAVLPCVQSVAQQEATEASRRVVNKVVPLYPELARKMRISGSVKLQVTIAPSGAPKNARPLGGHPLLVQAATDAVYKWKWVPAPQETTELIEIKFTPQ